MAEKTFNSRIIHKHDTEAKWSGSSFIPLKGELVIYDIDANHNYERFKIGDGQTKVSSLPFVDDAAKAEINSLKTTVDAVSALVGDTEVSIQIDNAMSSKVDKVDGKGLSTNDYTTAEKNKLSGIASGAEVNQNAFSNITVGSTTITADAKTDTLTLVAGKNVTITPDATNDKVTIAATDTVYTHPSYTAKSSGLYKVTVDNTGHVSGTSAVAKSDITALGIPAQDTTYSAATTSAAGLMSASDKTKLDGIATGANKITVDSALSSSSTNPVQNKVVNTAISNLNTLVGDTAVSTQISDAIDECITGLSVSGKTITYTKGDGTTGTITTQDTNTTYSTATSSTAGLVKIGYTESGKNYPVELNGSGQMYVNVPWTDNNTTYSAMTGATSSAAGKSGLVPAPAAGKNTSFLRGDGAWVVPTDTTYSVATTSANGLMSSTDKSKLDGIASGANKTTVDSALSSTSTNPVQNKVVNAAISGLNTLVGDTAVSTQISDAVDECITGLSVSGKVITYTKGDGTTGTITTQDTNTQYDPATTSAAGLMSAADKTKLNGIATGANAYTHPSYTARTGVPTANQTPAFGGTFSVSQPVSDAAGHITAINSRTITIPSTAATTSTAGLMSASDKTKLDGIATGANKITVDSALSSTSTNPVQNKAVNTAILNLNTLVGDTAVSKQIEDAIASKADSSHIHDDRYYTASEITTKLSGKSDTSHNHDTAYAAKSHGNHVPATETANNAKFLRNDNTWQTVTPANIGAAASSHGTHVTYSTTAPLMDGTASTGFAATVARSDHRHPTDTSRASASSLTALQDLVGPKAVATQISDAISGHTQSASTINAGVFNGQVCASPAAQSANTFLIRNSAVMSEETDPTNEGEIVWMYE